MVIAEAALSAAGKGMEAASKAYEAKQGYKAAKKNAKENKRKTLEELYSSALDREADLEKFGREKRGTNAARRAAALQEASNAFSKSLTGK
jgi:hypothetical protein